MTARADDMIDLPVRKSITVTAKPEDAFRIFTDGFDSWWPRSHHIGKSPMKRAIIESRQGGRCYTEQEDGTECDWGSILVWDPPRRFVLAWQITGNWQFEPDVEKSSEVEVRFTPEPRGKTRVDLEHRFFSRLTSGAAAMRAAVDAPTGWSGTLQLYATRVEQIAGAGA
jgi:uncharacterized protein YndB with AHSA1/START domain